MCTNLPKSRLKVYLVYLTCNREIDKGMTYFKVITHTKGPPCSHPVLYSMTFCRVWESGVNYFIWILCNCPLEIAKKGIFILKISRQNLMPKNYSAWEFSLSHIYIFCLFENLLKSNQQNWVNIWIYEQWYKTSYFSSFKLQNWGHTNLLYVS